MRLLIPGFRARSSDSSHVTTAEYIAENLTAIQCHVGLSIYRTCITTTINGRQTVLGDRCWLLGVRFCIKLVDCNVCIISRGVRTIATAIYRYLIRGTAIIYDDLSLATNITCQITATIYIIVGRGRGIVRLVDLDVCIAVHIGRCDNLLTAIESAKTATVDISAILAIAKRTAINRNRCITLCYSRLSTTIYITMNSRIARCLDRGIFTYFSETYCIFRRMEKICGRSTRDSSRINITCNTLCSTKHATFNHRITRDIDCCRTCNTGKHTTAIYISVNMCMFIVLATDIDNGITRKSSHIVKWIIV